MIKRTKSTPKQPLLYLWVLGYKTPPEDTTDKGEQVGEEEEAYVYYAPHNSPERVSLELERWTEAPCRVNGRFLYMREPLSWQALEAARLVPANLRTRLRLALIYDFYTCKEVPMTWFKPPHSSLEEGGEMIAWYDKEKLWGATSFTAPTGRMGTTFAKTREPLVEAALRHGYTPSPLMLDRVRELTGMDAIHPVFLDQRDAADRQSLLLTAILAHSVQGVSTQDPWLRLAGQPSEWLVSLLCEDRCMALSHVSETLPTVEQVLGRAFVVAVSLTDIPSQDAWMRAHASVAEALPYEVALTQTHALHTLLGSTYSEMLAATQNSGDHGPSTDMIRDQGSALHSEPDKQPGGARYTQHAFFSPLW